jgi:hypothetical protein
LWLDKYFGYLSHPSQAGAKSQAPGTSTSVK